MVFRKVGLYLISISLLFVFVIILKIDIPLCIGFDCVFLSTTSILKANIIPIICFVLLLLALFSYQKFKFDLSGATEIPFQAKNVEGLNYEHLTFLATYVIPLVSFDFDDARYLIVLGVLLVIMGVIYVKTDLFYANPSLALLGFHIYKADGSFKGGEEKAGLILISLRRLSNNEKVSYIKLDDRIFYVAKVN
ncbi:hypothetical protein C8E02_1121 [Vogesella indigofera]|uniref:Uncharacterized protein n=1 Tax=Vogesella indigofera TaxID=45465 RepID=A0A495BJ25_VOGIN|nr:anti-phage protein KwaA [Vogesella indigofera]RKQ61350.1 hypothetical protein C8E02_1121 [Vogesella indigofera]